MCIWFFICLLGAIAVLPLHFLSVEHVKLEERYGADKGTRIGEICGVVSGWGFFLFWIGLWVAPQHRFTVPLTGPLGNLSFAISVLGFSVPLTHLIICIPFVISGAWLGIKGVTETTLKAAETHRTDRIVTRGVYSFVRHPQYLGGLLAHVGVSFLLSGWFSLLSTPLLVVLVYLMSRKEEKELIKEFGREYEDYRRRVPMLFPKRRRA